MTPESERRCTAFAGDTRIASGTHQQVAEDVKKAVDAGEGRPVLVFDDVTSRPVELDLRGSVEDVARRYARPQGEDPSGAGGPDPAPRLGPGRPRLGVVAREVTLLPRHWAWLSSQRGGASATLRRVVEQARKDSAGCDRAREAQDATYRFMAAIAGDQPGYEEALRALYSLDGEGFETHTASWPADLGEHARRLAAGAFGAG
jgi:hypothetical protein